MSLLGLINEIFSCLCRDFSKDGITVKISVPEDLTIWAVPAQIQQVLMNLILNARTAMLPGGGTLTIKAENSSDAVTIQTTDTGCGIDPADLENIFEPFFTTGTGRKSQPETAGSGLGLSFCKKVMDEHNGYIWVRSKPDKGTSFTIVLPKPQQGDS